MVGMHKYEVKVNGGSYSKRVCRTKTAKVSEQSWKHRYLRDTWSEKKL